MSSHIQDPIVSGRPYLVTEVEGAAPASLDDFVDGGAPMTITLAEGRDRHVLSGSGVRTDGVVAFYEKAAGSGKDVRVWSIRYDEAGTFEAVHDPRF